MIFLFLEEKMINLNENANAKFEDKSLFLNFTQVCRDCKKNYETFKIDINKWYSETGEVVYISPQELYEKFSFSCECGCLNILCFKEICSKETIIFLRKHEEERKKYLGLLL